MASFWTLYPSRWPALTSWRSLVKIASVVILFVALGVLLFHPTSRVYTRVTYDRQTSTIPNQVHYVYAFQDPNADFKFEFAHYLSVYSAWLHWKPHTIYLHTNADATTIERARQGLAGKWVRLVLEVPGLQLNYMEAPDKAGNGVKLKHMEHKSDFMRVEAVYQYGGTYIDFDVYPLRDITPLRQSGFKGIGGRQRGGELNSGTFMAQKGGKMIRLWRDLMQERYDGGWTTHSNAALTAVGERLVRDPGEMLIMEREAFAPEGWSAEENVALFGIHNETSNLAHLAETSELPSYEEGFRDRWNHPNDFPSWARDWSSTYLLHGFKPARNNNPVEGFEHVTPSYILDRQSNIARAVYPAVRDMYQRGLISLGDTWDGM
ncbi:putative glycosyl transferase [Thozetella sp. PMI_491]|nr:putative glycosyl transferase [Thozetella sp. PMI_491]